MFSTKLTPFQMFYTVLLNVLVRDSVQMICPRMDGARGLQCARSSPEGSGQYVMFPCSSCHHCVRGKHRLTADDPFDLSH